MRREARLKDSRGHRGDCVKKAAEACYSVCVCGGGGMAAKKPDFTGDLSLSPSQFREVGAFEVPGK